MLPQIGDALRTHLAPRLPEGASVRLLASHEEPPEGELCVGLRLFDASVANPSAMGLHRNNALSSPHTKLDTVYLAIVYAPTANEEHTLLGALLEAVAETPVVSNDQVSLRLVARAIPIELRLAARHLMALPCILLGATPTA